MGILIKDRIRSYVIPYLFAFTYLLTAGSRFREISFLEPKGASYDILWAFTGALGNYVYCIETRENFVKTMLRLGQQNTYSLYSLNFYF